MAYKRKSCEQELIATPEMLQDFECNVCNCLLSVPPIRLIENRYICGRCPGEGLREISLERFAGRFQFPCRYVQEGCKLNLTWREVDEHEKGCGYKSANCTISNCGWKGTKVALVQHFDGMHASHVLSAKYSIKLSNIQSAKYFYFIGGDTAFEIEIENGKEQITYKVTALWTKLGPSSYGYNIAFLNEDVNLTLSHEANMFGVPSQLNKDTIKSVTDNLDEVQVHVKIEVLDKARRFFAECSNCSSPMYENIRVCTCGYSLCEICTCNSLVRDMCPKCEYKTRSCGLARNYCLEKFIDSLTFHLK